MKSALSFTAVIAVIAVVATVSLGCVSSAEASPVAPVLPESYHATFTAFWPDGSHPSYSELFYDWGTMRCCTVSTRYASRAWVLRAKLLQVLTLGSHLHVCHAHSQVTQHTNCISGFPEQTAHPCSLIMRGNNTYVVSAYVDNGCCRFPDCVGKCPATKQNKSSKYHTHRVCTT